MTTCSRLFQCLLTSSLVVAAFPAGLAAQDLTVYEPVLLPISVGVVPGAYGTRWSTDLWYRNNSGKPVVVFPLAESDHVPTIGRTIQLRVPIGTADAPGRLLYVSRDGGGQVQFDLRLFNLADPEANWGIKLPVVREHEFAEAIHLINVPTSATFRSALRVYAYPDVAPGQPVRVRIYASVCQRDVKRDSVHRSCDARLTGPRDERKLSRG